MNDLSEAFAVIALSTAIVMAVYGLVTLQNKVFSFLFSKYCAITAKLALFVSICFYGY